MCCNDCGGCGPTCECDKPMKKWSDIKRKTEPSMPAAVTMIEVRNAQDFTKGLEEARNQLLPRLSQYKRQYHVEKDRADHFKRKVQELNERATKAEAQSRKLLTRIDEMSHEIALAMTDVDETRKSFAEQDESTWGQEGDYSDFWGDEDTTDVLADDYLVEDEP